MSSTRYLTAVFIEGRIVHAHYGQFDGYPSGAGLVVKNFLADHDAVTRLLKNLPTIRSVTSEVFHQLWEDYTSNNKPAPPNTTAALVGFHRKYPGLDPRLGAGWLRYVADEPEVFLEASRAAFAANLNCAWAYVVNFDTLKLEVYEGGRTSPGNYGVFANAVDTLFEPLEGPDGEVIFPCQKVVEFDIATIRELSDEEFQVRCLRAMMAEPRPPHRIELNTSDEAIEAARQAARIEFAEYYRKMRKHVGPRANVSIEDAAAAAWRAGIQVIVDATPAPEVPTNPIARLRALRTRAQDLAEDISTWLDATDIDRYSHESPTWRAVRAAESEARDAIGSLDAALEVLNGSDASASKTPET